MSPVGKLHHIRHPVVGVVINYGHCPDETAPLAGLGDYFDLVTSLKLHHASPSRESAAGVARIAVYLWPVLPGMARHPLRGSPRCACCSRTALSQSGDV